MTTEQLLNQPPEKLARTLNRTLEEQAVSLEQWIEQQAIDREYLLRYLEAGGYSYLPSRNRIE